MLFGKNFLFVLSAVGMGFIGCGEPYPVPEDGGYDDSSNDCARTGCYQDNVWCFDQFGERTGLQFSCSQGCKDGKCLTCAYTDCNNGDVWCFDQNGSPAYLKESCESSCEDGKCKTGCRTDEECIGLNRCVKTSDPNWGVCKCPWTECCTSSDCQNGEVCSWSWIVEEPVCECNKCGLISSTCFSDAACSGELACFLPTWENDKKIGICSRQCSMPKEQCYDKRHTNWDAYCVAFSNVNVCLAFCKQTSECPDQMYCDKVEGDNFGYCEAL